ncbi:MAG: FAD-binding oxidoreductase [Pseudomonadota bacterium]
MESYWAETAGADQAWPTVQGALTADVVIVGGGYLGLSCALQLAAQATNVILLDAQTPGWGASGRNGGQIIPGHKYERTDLVEKLGEERGGRLFSWAGTFADQTLDLIERYQIDCDASQSGWIQPAHAKSVLDKMITRVREWEQEGANPKIVDAAETSRLLGTDWYKGAYVDPRGGRLHPLKYARGLARAAADAGASIFANSAATKLERVSGKWNVSTASGTVFAEQVLICTNAYTEAGDHLIKGLYKSVVPFPSYIIGTGPLTDNQRESILPDGQTAADLKQLINYFRLEADGCFLFGGRGPLRETDDPGVYEPIRRKMLEFFPQLAAVPMQYGWSGRVALTSDGLPHLHNAAPGLWASLGCNGRGVGYATGTGKLLAELIQGSDPAQSPIPITPVSRIPFHSLYLLGAGIAVWHKNRCDQVERNRSA